jgi:hypothetical protein
MAPIPWVLSFSQSLIMAVATGVSIRKDDVDQLILFRFPAPEMAPEVKRYSQRDSFSALAFARHRF